MFFNEVVFESRNGIEKVESIVKSFYRWVGDGDIRKRFLFPRRRKTGASLVMKIIVKTGKETGEDGQTLTALKVTSNG